MGVPWEKVLIGGLVRKKVVKANVSFSLKYLPMDLLIMKESNLNVLDLSFKLDKSKNFPMSTEWN